MNGIMNNRDPTIPHPPPIPIAKNWKNIYCNDHSSLLLYVVSSKDKKYESYHRMIAFVVVSVSATT